MKKLKLMADYFCFPLWSTESDSSNIDVYQMPISNELKQQTMAWAKKYDSTLNQDYPPDSKFESVEKRTAFIQEGNEIAKKLNNELNDDYFVTFDMYWLNKA
jgi:hypothetical protein